MNIKKLIRRGKVLHETFKASIFLKGVDGVLEIVGGIMLFIVSPSTINRLVLLITAHELSEDPKDIIARYLIESSRDLSVSTRMFGSFYLLSHGVIKVALVLSLWKGRLWSYPAAIVFFIIFIIYQMYRFSYSHSMWLVLLSVFDVIIVLLTWMEYKNLKNRDGI